MISQPCCPVEDSTVGLPERLRGSRAIHKLTGWVCRTHPSTLDLQELAEGSVLARADQNVQHRTKTYKIVVRNRTKTYKIVPERTKWKHSPDLQKLAEEGRHVREVLMFERPEREVARLYDDCGAVVLIWGGGVE